jgi:hypothetical protein
MGKVRQLWCKGGFDPKTTGGWTMKELLVELSMYYVVENDRLLQRLTEVEDQVVNCVRQSAARPLTALDEEIRQVTNLTWPALPDLT